MSPLAGIDLLGDGGLGVAVGIVGDAPDLVAGNEKEEDLAQNPRRGAEV